MNVTRIVITTCLQSELGEFRIMQKKYLLIIISRHHKETFQILIERIGCLKELSIKQNYYKISNFPKSKPIILIFSLMTTFTVLDVRQNYRGYLE